MKAKWTENEKEERRRKKKKQKKKTKSFILKEINVRLNSMHVCMYML